ncbi:unnamed protein product [Pedinophyceae sp. YPF-701]|nr:unnamed protein product [Pedinophyceae sp. YPF-701]
MLLTSRVAQQLRSGPSRRPARTGQRRAGGRMAPQAVATASPDELARAKGYPYDRPDSSFVFINGNAYCFPDATWPGTSGLLDLQVSDPTTGAECAVRDVCKGLDITWEPPSDESGWTPVLAIGSNAGVAQLARKYPRDLFPGGVVIPVVQSLLCDLDVVYAPLISSYGSATATLEHAPGCTTQLFVTFLDDAALARMHETEGAYHLVQLNDVDLKLGFSLAAQDRGEAPSAALQTVLQYNHQKGTLNLPLGERGAPSPVALAEIASRGRTLPALGQIAMQRAVMAAVGTPAPGASLDDARRWARDADARAGCEDTEAHDAWISRNLKDDEHRRGVVKQLTDMARPFSWPNHDVKEKLGNVFSANVK